MWCNLALGVLKAFKRVWVMLAGETETVDGVLLCTFPQTPPAATRTTEVPAMRSGFLQNWKSQGNDRVGPTLYSCKSALKVVIYNKQY